MAECDGFFRDNGMEFDPANTNLAVSLAHREAGKDQGYAKWLIMCWFDNLYGQWNGDKFDNGESRSQMSAFLSASGYDTFESLFNDPNAGGSHHG